MSLVATPVLLSIVAALATGAVSLVALAGTAFAGFAGFRWLSNRRKAAQAAPAAPVIGAMPVGKATALTGILSHLTQMLHVHSGGELSPMLKSLARSAVKQAIALDEANDHKVLDAFLAHVGLAPAAPLANLAASAIEKKIDTDLAANGAGESGQIHKAIQGLVAAIQAQHAAQQQATAA